MQIELKDVLHLYLGRRHRYRFVDWQPDTWSPWLILTPSRLDTLLNDLSIEKIEMELRPLSSIAKDDIDLGDFIPDFEILLQRFTGGYKIEIDSAMDDGYCLTVYPDGSMYCICKDNNENYPFNGSGLFVQLLKQGFDLFNLIESGQAIDATKQTAT